jgi:hypothetical protein
MVSGFNHRAIRREDIREEKKRLAGRQLFEGVGPV